MKTTSVFVAVAILAAAGGGGLMLYRIGMNQGMKMAAPMAEAASESAGEAGQQPAKSDRKVLYWHDPMVPGQRFDKPGKSPFMDMQLVPVYGGDAADEGKTIISPRVQQNLGMRTAEVVKGTLTAAVVAVGSVAWNDRDVEVVQARSPGFVERLYVRAPLDPVRKGQPLLDLYVPDWVAAQEEFFTVQRMKVSGVDGLIDGARQRMRLVGMSDEQISRVEAGGKVLPRLTIMAPVGGVVSELIAREGMTVMAGAPLFRINGTGTIWINAEVPENVSGQVRPGVAVEATTPSVPGKVFKGKVGSILPEVNPVTRTIKARIELANPSGLLLPGMFATINFTPAAAKGVLLVPSEAVIQTGTRNVVIVAQGEGRFVPVDVQLGAEVNGQSEIRKGLEAGQKVVVSGQFLIDSESSLKSSLARMGDAPASAADKPAAASHRGEGKIVSIERDEIVLAHGPIPSLQWGSMTMGFKLPANGLPKNLKPGDPITFAFQQKQDGANEITEIAPAVAASTAATPNAAKAGAMAEPMTMPPAP
ncbi:MAG: efflux RND transporter periplasmic adaptor subunit, partial [Betaproteobacteria bacterium]